MYSLQCPVLLSATEVPVDPDFSSGLLCLTDDMTLVILVVEGGCIHIQQQHSEERAWDKEEILRVYAS